MRLISVVMPTYNQEKFIREAIDSILQQTYTLFELIIVDDGSTDNTPQILNEIQDKRLVKVRKENGGTGSALNLGFSMAGGEYETWLASDNKLYPVAFERMAAYLDKHQDVDYVYTNCDIGIMNGVGDVEAIRKNLSEELDQSWDREKLDRHYFLGIVWLWRKAVREKAGPFQIEPCEDYDMVLKMADSGCRFAFLNENLGWFRRHKGSMTAKIIRDPANGGDPAFYSKLVQRKSKQRRALCGT